MKLVPACLQARLDSFLAPKPKSSRRTSARSKKTQQSQSGWPLTSPTPQELAFAGFVWKPTSASPDNVQCFACGCQLDGWEPSDVPAFEHLTHSPTCGYAINMCIRARNGDPDRAEEDPMSEKLLDARRATFGDSWPLDSAAGFPSVEQMIEAGWYYDPNPEGLDGATCAYCNLSLDCWDAGDNPLDEHRRRAPDCLFFALKELYHPAAIPFTETSKKQKATRTKRSSTRSSTRSSSATRKVPAAKASTTKAPTAKAKAAPKTTRAKPAAHANDTQQFSDASAPDAPVSEAPRQIQSKKRSSSVVDLETPHEAKRARESDLRLSISSIRPESVFESTPNYMLITPEKEKPSKQWDPINVESFFEQKGDIFGLLSNIMVDAGLDKENIHQNPVEAVKAGLTSPEKKMTLEQWVLYNAKRGEEKLRAECERQIAAFEAEGRKALTALEAL